MVAKEDITEVVDTIKVADITKEDMAEGNTTLGMERSRGHLDHGDAGIVGTRAIPVTIVA